MIEEISLILVAILVLLFGSKSVIKLRCCGVPYFAV